MGIDHVERFQIGAAGSMNNTSKFRRIDAFGQWCLQWGRSEELRLAGFQFSIMSCTAWAAQRESEQSQNGGVWCEGASETVPYLFYRTFVRPAAV